MLAGLLTGCTHHAGRRTKVEARLAEESRALTTAVVDVLQNQPAAERDAHTATALVFARQDQRIEGLPAQPFDVPAVLAAARAEIQERFAAQEKWLGERRAVEAKLLELGARGEAERNGRITRWSRFGAGALGLLGGLAALVIFVPVALPLGGRLLAWCVGKVPALAGALGVVSVKAFDAVVKGIERTKQTSSEKEPGRVPPTVPVANTLLARGDSRRGTDDAGLTGRLEANLGRAMDGAHKQLVRARRAALNQ